jgi:hypothetical protein
MEPRPSQSEQRPVLLSWLMKFLNCVDEGLHRNSITGGFGKAGIYPLLPEIVTSGLPLSYPDSLLLKRKNNSFNIGNEVVTDPDFLLKWEQHEKKNE